MSTNERNAEVITHESTGTSRVLFAPRPADGGSDHVERVLNASSRVQIRDHSFNQSHVSVTTGNEASATDNAGRITHARTQAGMDRSGADITADHLISVDGVQLRIRDAVAAGIVRHNADGSYTLAGGASLPGK